MNTCQHCGTELASKRAKNCNACNAIKAEAMKYNVYGAAMDALNAAKDADLTGESVHEAARDAIATARGVLSAEAAAERQRERDQKEQRRRRFARNEVLRRHGYTWSATIDDDEQKEWTLFSSDGRVVTVAEAVSEINNQVKP